MTRDGQLMLSLAAMGLAAQLYSGALPERSTVAAWPPDPVHRGHVRTQSLQTGSASLVVGIGSAIVSRSWWPLLGTLAVVAYLSGTYASAASSGDPGLSIGAAVVVEGAARWR